MAMKIKKPIAKLKKSDALIYEQTLNKNVRTQTIKRNKCK